MIVDLGNRLFHQLHKLLVFHRKRQVILIFVFAKIMVKHLLQLFMQQAIFLNKIYRKFTDRGEIASRVKF